MKVIWIKGPSWPYVESNTLYLPSVQNDSRWAEITTEPTAAVIRLEWVNIGELGRVAEWVFFKDEQEISWNEVQDKVSIARSFREWHFHPDDVIPWGDGIEALVTLERM